MELNHKALDFEVRQVGKEEDRTLEFIGSTGHVDRYGDIIEPGGWDLKNYKKNPVFLFGHDYRQPPVGKAVKVWVDGNALKFHIKFADAETYAFADTIYRLYQGGFMRATSVGFADKEREPIIDKKNEGQQTGWRFLKQELYELSAVPVPANPNALMLAVQKGIATPKDIETMTGVPFEPDLMKEAGGKEYPSDTGSWDESAEIKAADVSDLAVICAWFDDSAPDKKGSYQLLHHRAKDGHAVVWAGVTAAMATLLRATDGLDIPEECRKVAYDHLAGHYAQFEETPPKFKEYDDPDDLRLIALGLDPVIVTPEDWPGTVTGLLDVIETLRSRVAELEGQHVRFVDLKLTGDDFKQIVTDQVKAAVKGALQEIIKEKGSKGGKVNGDYISLVLNPGYEPEGGRPAGEDEKVREKVLGIIKQSLNTADILQ